jgi:trehalose 6-phosphate synthase
VSRLVVVSNRVPSAEGKPAAGGLAVAMTSALQKSGGLWFGWSGCAVENPVGPAEFRDQDGITYATVDLSRTSHHGYYEGYANQTLWPLFHYRLDLTVFDRSTFEQYRAVNVLFAERLAPLLDPDDLIWVQDYHLIPLGEELRRLGCRQRIGFFLHTPFPAPEILVTLFNHKRLARALLNYDLIGYQTPDDLKSFRDYVVQELRNGHVFEDGRVGAYDVPTRAGAFPISIDPEAFSALAVSPTAQRYRERVRKSLAESALILSVDRLDYTKGLPERMAAIELLFERYPEHRRRVSFLQIASPSRSEVPQYQAIRQELEGAVGQINGRFAESDWSPVRYVSKTYSQAELCGLYPLARVGLVTPLRDGMNLVAKEFVAAQDPDDPGVLVLSRFAGAAHQMEGATIVNPYDTVDVADAVHQALGMSREERLERWTVMIAGLRRDNLAAWRDGFLAELNRAQGAEAKLC